jgi:hypothetical protein
MQTEDLDMPETNFFWDPLSDNILQERDETGTVTAEYTTEPGLYGDLISQNRGSVESQYHFDPQGSTLALTDDNQQVTDTYAYAAFGDSTEGTGSSVNAFRFVGQKQYCTISTTGAILARDRLYRPSTGTWLSPYLHVVLGRIAEPAEGFVFPNSFASRTFDGGTGSDRIASESRDGMEGGRHLQIYVGYSKGFGRYKRWDEGDLPWMYPYESTTWQYRKIKLPLGVRIPIPEIVRRRISLSHVCDQDGFGNKQKYTQCLNTTQDPNPRGTCPAGFEHVTVVEYNKEFLRYDFKGKCIRCNPPDRFCNKGEVCVPCLLIGTDAIPIPTPGGGFVIVEKHSWTCKCIKFEKGDGKEMEEGESGVKPCN